jgi:hypothetical protein
MYSQLVHKYFVGKNDISLGRSQSMSDALFQASSICNIYSVDASVEEESSCTTVIYHRWVLWC